MHHIIKYFCRLNIDAYSRKKIAPEGVGSECKLLTEVLKKANFMGIVNIIPVISQKKKSHPKEYEFIHKIYK